MWFCIIRIGPTLELNGKKKKKRKEINSLQTSLKLGMLDGCLQTQTLWQPVTNF